MNEAAGDQTLQKIIGWIGEIRPDDSMAITPEAELLTEGLLDSMDLLQLVTYMEDEFNVVMEPEYLVPENFVSPRRIAEFIHEISA